MVTTNHQLNKPGRSTQDWDVPINNNFTALDSKIELRDAASNLGNYSPKNGAKFLASDTGEVWFGDGSQWVKFGTFGDYISISDAGTEVLASPPDLNFGSGLDAAADGDGTITVTTTATGGGVDAENTDGTSLVSNVDAIQAGKNLKFGDDGDGTVTLDGSATATTYTDSITKSGTGSQTRFTVSHSMGVTPSAVSTTATSEDAMSDRYIDNVDSNSFDIVYYDAPPSGTSNLTWLITLIDGAGGGTDSVGAASISDDTTKILTGPNDINFATGLSVTDDGDGTVTIDATGATDTHTDISNSTGTVVQSVGDITFTAKNAASISVTDDGDGTGTVEVSATDTNTDTDTHVAVENTNGSTLVSDVDAMYAGTNVKWVDDGDGSVTLEATNTDTNTHINVENDDGTTLVQSVSAVEAGHSLSFSDDGDGSVTLDALTDLNLVDFVEAGADPTGGTDAVPVLDSVAADDTLVVVPPGTYAIGQQFKYTNFTRFGIIAPAGGVTFKISASAGGDNTPVFLVGSSTYPGDELVVKNIDFDVTTAGAGMCLATYVNETLRVENCEVVGKTHHDTATLQPNIVTQQGSGTVKSWRAPDGSESKSVSSTSDLPTGVYVHTDHMGTLRFEDCFIKDFPNNGLYASDANGPSTASGKVIVEGGYFINNNVAGVRLPDNGVVRDATFIIKAVPYSSFTPSVYQRGVWAYYGDCHVENCKFEVTTNSDANTHALNVNAECASLTVEASEFQMSGSRHALYIPSFSSTNYSNNGVTISDCRITGSAGTGTEWYAGQSWRAKTTVVDTVIEQPNRGGIELRGADSRADKNYIDVAEQGIDVEAAWCQLQENYGESTNQSALTLTSNSSDCLVKDNILASAVSDSGTTNTVSGNKTGWTAA